MAAVVDPLVYLGNKVAKYHREDRLYTVYPLRFPSLDHMVLYLKKLGCTGIKIEFNFTHDPNRKLEKDVIEDMRIRLFDYIADNNNLPWLVAGFVPKDGRSSNIQKISQKLDYFNKLIQDDSIRQAFYEKDTYFDLGGVDFLLDFVKDLIFDDDSEYVCWKDVIEKEPGYGFLSSRVGIPTYASGRPKTTMSFVGEPNPISLSEDVEVDDYGIIRVSEEEKYLPVIRYAAGMSGGYYSGPSSARFCGTFYYLELESPFLLRFSREAIFHNKIAAYFGMKASLGAADSRLDNFLNFRSTTNKTIMNFINSLSHRNFPDTGAAVQQYFVEGRTIYNADRTHFFDPLTNTDEEGKYQDQFYALEDPFDQAICLMGRRLGYDAIILLNMVGKTRVVTEILDTRDRKISYENILELK